MIIKKFETYIKEMGYKSLKFIIYGFYFLRQSKKGYIYLNGIKKFENYSFQYKILNKTPKQQLH